MIDDPKVTQSVRAALLRPNASALLRKEAPAPAQAAEHPAPQAPDIAAAVDRSQEEEDGNDSPIDSQ